MSYRVWISGVAAVSWMGAAVAVGGCAEDADGNATSSGGSGGEASGGGSTTGGSGGTGPGGGATGGGGAMSGDACNAPEVAPSNGACALDNMGNLMFLCNPVTNDGCPDTQSCDVSGFTNFECYQGNTAGICEACNQGAPSGPFCQTGLTCYAPDPNEPQGAGTLTECARYCCDNTDCDGATCVKSTADGPWFQQAPNIGVCQNT